MEIIVSDKVPELFVKEIKGILSNKEFLSLDDYGHHRRTSRFMHSLNVSYLSWWLARKLHCNEKVAARAGLLHDFCPYDFKEKTPTGEHQAFYHPKAAMENSFRVFQINDRERDAIRTHMFPLGPIPRNAEGWIITLADKICAAMELCNITIALAREKRLVIVKSVV